MKIIDDNGTDTLGVPYVMFQPVKRESIEKLVENLDISETAEIEAHYCEEKVLLRLVVKISREDIGGDLSSFMARHVKELARMEYIKYKEESDAPQN